MSARVMVLDDDESFARAVRNTLKSDNIEAVCASTPAEALQIYQKERMDFVLLMVDWTFHGLDINGTDFALQIKQINPHQPILFMTGHDGGEDMLISMLQAGNSRNFIRKGKNLDKDAIRRTVRSTLKDVGYLLEHKAADTLEHQEQRAAEIAKLGLVGQSKAFYEIARLVNQLRRFRSRFLVIGPEGTGKEKIAQAFEVKGKPFFAVNCARYSHGQEQFLESELYGHKKGAYTGADRDQVGIFEQARGGVVFLDEIHCLSLAAQSKLLRTIQEMRCRSLGDTSDREIKLDFTLVSATQPRIYGMIEQGEFKSDLFHRLSSSVIRIPPLCHRKDDIRPIARHFFEHYSRAHKIECQPHPQLLNDLEAYSWHGNVRELQNFIENSVMQAKEAFVGPDVFLRYLMSQNEGASSQEKVVLDLPSVVAEAEKTKIISALLKSSTILDTANVLKIPRTTLNDRIKKLGIDPRLYLGKGKI